jgi:hypothetical protein
MNPLDLQDADSWIEEAGKKGGGLGAEFQAVQAVITAQTLRHQWIGEGDLSDLYLWYREHLVRLHNSAQGLAGRGWASVTYHLNAPNPYSNVALMMTIRAILATLPEVSNPEDEIEYTPVALETDGDNKE